MAALVPIEDVGPCLAFGIVYFLRIFVTAASPGVVAGNPSETKTAPGLFQIVEANSGAGRNDGFQEPLRKKKRIPGNFFNWKDLKPEPESEQGFRGQEVLVAGTGSSVDLVCKLVLSFPGMPAEEDFEISGSVPHPDHPSVT